MWSLRSRRRCFREIGRVHEEIVRLRIQSHRFRPKLGLDRLYFTEFVRRVLVENVNHALPRRGEQQSRLRLVRRRSALSCDGIIGLNLRRSFFQRRAGLATLVATTAAGRQRIDVQDVPLDEALRVADAALPGLLTPFTD